MRECMAHLGSAPGERRTGAGGSLDREEHPPPGRIIQDIADAGLTLRKVPVVHVRRMMQVHDAPTHRAISSEVSG